MLLFYISNTCYLIYIFFTLVLRLLIITVYFLAPHWFKDMKEVANSVLSPGCMDLPIDAGMWLKHFKSQNLQLLSQLDVCIF